VLLIEFLIVYFCPYDEKISYGEAKTTLSLNKIIYSAPPLVCYFYNTEFFWGGGRGEHFFAPDVKIMDTPLRRGKKSLFLFGFPINKGEKEKKKSFLYLVK